MAQPRCSDPIPSGPWDVVVIGAGAAGLMTCLDLPAELKVLLLNRNTGRRSSSRWAQGGIAAVTRKEDSAESHAEDTELAGAGLCDGDAVRLLVQEAPHCVERLGQLGMAFDRDQDGLATTLEAAHSHRRVLHVQDRTGRALVDVLRDRVEQRPGLLHRRGVRVTQLLVRDGRCCGVQVLDGAHLHGIEARAVVLASGGGGHLFANTTNPAQACGEGIALAWQAGAAVEDLEFVQFHPTAIRLDDAPCFLISEAVRGEGGVLVDSLGGSPVAHLPQRDLSPRDQVSRALMQAMQRQRVKQMWLDFAAIPRDQAERRFPTILDRCDELGLNPLERPIPVAPAAHYWMGGVATDLQAATTLPGLYAVGEVACTGLHGANRLASNSLMECLVFAHRLKEIELGPIPTALGSSRTQPLDLDLNGSSSSQLIDAIEQLRQLCWRRAGVERSAAGLRQALGNVKAHEQQLEQQALLQALQRDDPCAPRLLAESSRRDLNLLLDLHHRLLTSHLMLEACLFRGESRGGHYRSDAPAPLPQWRQHSRQQRQRGIVTRAVRD
ncbi:L-aspartate oxidase [Synechococcus sp. A15-62]|uniref:L-aspartate oxidase n=1 Tax=Synechococcus sp. A15-62 TaxID=1050657 RepID=UPI0016446ED7|nr:L-aspartate oxidase [Synechococcus sp. A15-62]